MPETPPPVDVSSKTIADSKSLPIDLKPSMKLSLALWPVDYWVASTTIAANGSPDYLPEETIALTSSRILPSSSEQVGKSALLHSHLNPPKQIC